MKEGEVFLERSLWAERPRTRGEGEGRRRGAPQGRSPEPGQDACKGGRGPRPGRHCNTHLWGFSGNWGASEMIQSPLQRRRSLEMTRGQKKSFLRQRNGPQGPLQRWAILGSVPASDVLLSCPQHGMRSSVPPVWRRRRVPPGAGPPADDLATRSGHPGPTPRSDPVGWA